jgi:uncharacterized protein (TIGR00297 family)
LDVIATRVVIGLVLATIAALTAHRMGALTTAGATAAAVVGAVAAAAGWSWALLLVLYFASSVALTRFGQSAKVARTSDVVEKGGTRDAAQVIANGGVVAVAALLWVATGAEAWRALGAGALAAAASDTWATEIGMLAARAPRSIVSWRPVPAGTSGAVSAAGLAAAGAGAAFVALAAYALGWPRETALAALAGGVAGSTTDSLLGASLQVRRWCDRCGLATERDTHTCGTPSRVVGGARWLDNDAVNAVGTAAGGLLAVLVSA